MRKSESIKNVMTALGQFQAKAVKIRKDSVNPHFKSKYASLSVILDEIQPVLTECNLVFTQIPEGSKVLTTVLFHSESGEFIESDYDLNAVASTPQAIGSAITYARRYSLTSTLGLNIDDDDDGNEASKAAPQAINAAPKQQAPPQQAQAPIQTAFNKTYPDPNAIGAVLEAAKEGKDIVLLYTANKAVIDGNPALKAAFKTAETKIKNGGKLIPTDDQIKRIIERIYNGDAAAYNNAVNAFILNAPQLEELRVAARGAKDLESALAIKYVNVQDIENMIGYCRTEKQVLQLHSNNAMIIDRTPELQTKVNAKLRTFKPAA